MNIPLWSENNPKVKDMLLPTDTIAWSALTPDDKKRIWQYLDRFLFNPSPNSGNEKFNEVSCKYEFFGDSSWENDHFVKIVAQSIITLNDRYKKKSYARNFLDDSTFDSACYDFYDIYKKQDMDVVFEMFTIYANFMVISDSDRLWKKQEESSADFDKRKDKEKWKRFDKFSKELSIVFEDFGINYKLTRAGFIPAEEPQVVEKIYRPALKKLSSQKWAEVNRDLKDAFEALNKDKNGSGALTHALAALQAFLQILVNNKTGKGDTGKLINEAIKRRLIPDDDFSKKVIKEMISFWAKERQDKGDPHPKKTYATKSQAKLVISLIMVFVDHSL